MLPFRMPYALRAAVIAVSLFQPLLAANAAASSIEPVRGGQFSLFTTLDAVSCGASTPDGDGKTANEKVFRGVIRQLWEKPADKGMDGAVTIQFEKMTIGAPRAWRPTATDSYSQADPKKPIYPVRVAFSTCTDYRTAISMRQMERIYDCFTHKTGGIQCTQTGASGPLALKDKKEYIPKK
jgi:hypothetical protein